MQFQQDCRKPSIFGCTGVKPSRALYATGLMVAVWASGCGTAVPAGMVRVRGVVRYDGQPLPDGTILFESFGGKGSAAGRILPGGAFETVMMPGEYQIAVRSLDGVATYQEGNQTKPIQPKSRVPQRYASIATSGLRLTVTPRGDPLLINLEQ